MSFCSGTILVNQSRFRFLDRFANCSPKMQPSAKTYNTTLSMQTADAKRNKENWVESSKNISPIRLTESRKTHSEKRGNRDQQKQNHYNYNYISLGGIHTHQQQIWKSREIKRHGVVHDWWNWLIAPAIFTKLFRCFFSTGGFHYFINWYRFLLCFDSTFAGFISFSFLSTQINLFLFVFFLIDFSFIAWWGWKEQQQTAFMLTRTRRIVCVVGGENAHERT